MNGIQIIEASLVLFWAGYIGLNWWLLRSAVNEGTAPADTATSVAPGMGKLHGEIHA